MFNLFKKQKPEDNFDLIAMNIVAIYESLKKKFNGRFQKEDDLLTTCGVIDCLVYLKEGSISMDDLKHAVIAAKVGTCFVGITDITHEDSVETMLKGPKNLLLNFTMQIETMIFYADNKQVGAKDTIYAVISKKKDIKKMISTTRENKNEKFLQIYQSANHLTNAFMTTDEFKEIRDQLEFLKSS